MTHLLAESLLHTCTPFALRFGGNFGIRWYGLAYAAGFFTAWLLMRWMAATHRSPMTKIQVGDFLTWAVMGVIVGGRVGHVVFYDHAAKSATCANNIPLRLHHHNTASTTPMIPPWLDIPPL